MTIAEKVPIDSLLVNYERFRNTGDFTSTPPAVLDDFDEGVFPEVEAEVGKGDAYDGVDLDYDDVTTPLLSRFRRKTSGYAGWISRDKPY